MDSRWILSFAIIVAMLSGCAGKSEQFDTVEAPELHSGYAWTYQVEGSGSASATTKINGDIVEQESESEPFGPDLAMVFEILGTGFEADGEPAAIAAVSGSELLDLVFMAGEPSGANKYAMGLRLGDLSYLEAELSQTQQCVEDACNNVVSDIKLGDASFLDPYLDFPLTPGKTWSQDASNTAADPGLAGSYFEITSEALRQERIGIVNGSVDAILVVHSIRMPEAQAMIDAAREELKNAGLEDVKLDFKADANMMTWYAPEAKAVAKERLFISIDLYLSFKADGDRYEAQGVATVDVTTTLAGVSLVAEPDRDMAGVLGFFNNNEPINDPTGDVAVPDGAYEIRVDQDVMRLNAAAEESAAFTVNVTPALPDGHVIRYTITGPNGGLQHSDTASEWTFTPSGPGVYGVLAQAFDANGDLQAHDSTNLVANYHLTVSTQCSTPIAIDCATHLVPMQYGIQTATFTLEGASTADTVPSNGVLRLTDSDGNVYDDQVAAGDNGNGVINLDDFAGVPLDTEWQLQWDPDAEALSEGTLTIDLIYGAAKVEESVMTTMLRIAMPDLGPVDMFDLMLMPSS